MDALNKRKFGFFLLWFGLIFLSTLPPRRECKSIGKRNAAPISESENKDNRTTELKVVGGRKVKSGEFPWLISLQEQKHPGGNFQDTCGGSIVGERYILTAAHCINHPSAPSRYKVLINVHKLPKSTEDHPKRNIYEVEELILTNFDTATFENDIALLRLTKSIPLTADADVLGRGHKINLPKAGMEYTGNATVAGWGDTAEDGSSSDVPRSAVVPVLTQEECLEAFSDYYNNNSMICAGYKRGEIDACQGDSGGPLFLKGGEDAILIGIVSNGKGCARPETPGRYTKVSHYIGWIKSHVRDA